MKNAGVPLKTVWGRLRAATVFFRRAQLHLIAAAPNVGKSVFALTLAIKSEARCLYFSADSDEHTQYSRAVSILTGEDVGVIQARMDKAVKTGESLPEYDHVLEQIQGRIRFDFNPGPSTQDIEDAVLAYAYLHGEYPQLIVIDNLSNCVDDNGSEGFVGLENIVAFLHELARRTKACTVALHHLVGEYENGDKPAPLGGLRGKISKLPEVVLNLYREEYGMGERLGVAIVKNRGGRGSAAGRYTVSLALDLQHMSITDPEPERSGLS